MSDIKEPGGHDEHLPHLPINILINNRPYKAPKTPMTVSELMTLANLPPDFSFYQVVQNKNVGPLPSDRSLDLHPGDRFICLRGEDPS